MRFRTRAFLCCFVPFALLLAGSFWMIQKLAQSTVRDGLRASLRDNHRAIARLRAKSDLQNSRFLKIAGENAALKAGVQLLLQNPANDEARRTVEDQLYDLCERMGFDLLMYSGPPAPGDRDLKNTAPLAGVLRTNGVLQPLTAAGMNAGSAGRSGLSLLNGVAYQIASVPLDQAEENIGALSVGEVFDLSAFTTPTVLFHQGRVLESSLTGVGLAELESALGRCPGTSECDIPLHGSSYISLPMDTASPGDASPQWSLKDGSTPWSPKDGYTPWSPKNASTPWSPINGYTLWSLQNVDQAVAPVLGILRRVFLSVTLGAVLVALIFSLASAGSIVRPIAKVVERLKEAERTGDLAEFPAEISPVREIRDLTDTFNRAASSIREGRDNLNRAYLEFVESLASALDARDRYTAGHSHRVSELSRTLASRMNLPPAVVERVRVGALLHDIGKIGVSDGILQKSGRLSPDEAATVRKHPEIGRRILEGVDGFGDYLAAVELHHENWDGTGYPHGQSGETTPIEARIIHVTDAYDAMTTDRPYRRGMQPEEAIAILREAAGTQFDPAVAMAFASIFGNYNRSEYQRDPRVGASVAEMETA